MAHFGQCCKIFEPVGLLMHVQINCLVCFVVVVDDVVDGVGVDMYVVAKRH